MIIKIGDEIIDTPKIWVEESYVRYFRPIWKDDGRWYGLTYINSFIEKFSSNELAVMFLNEIASIFQHNYNFIDMDLLLSNFWTLKNKDKEVKGEH